MIRIFTYHRVLDCADNGEPEYYRISSGQLAEHLEVLTSRGWETLLVQDLGNAALENRYVLTFDDGTSDHYEVVLPLLKRHGCRGSFYVSTARLDRPGYLTRTQVREMAAAGHEIGSHSHEHQRMDVLSEADIRQQIAKSQEILAEVTGSKPVTFVPPGGFMNERVGRIAGELGMRALRTMRWGYNQKLDLMSLETVPINRYTDQKELQKLLEPRSAPLLYAGKEALKRLIPMTQYEKLRRLAFRIWKSN